MIYMWDHVGVSKNRGGPPKWMVNIMVPNPVSNLFVTSLFVDSEFQFYSARVGFYRCVLLTTNIPRFLGRDDLPMIDLGTIGIKSGVFCSKKT